MAKRIHKLNLTNTPTAEMYLAIDQQQVDGGGTYASKIKHVIGTVIGKAPSNQGGESLNQLNTGEIVFSSTINVPALNAEEGGQVNLYFGDNSAAYADTYTDITGSDTYTGDKIGVGEKYLRLVCKSDAQTAWNGWMAGLLLRVSDGRVYIPQSASNPFELAPITTGGTGYDDQAIQNRINNLESKVNNLSVNTPQVPPDSDSSGGGNFDSGWLVVPQFSAGSNSNYADISISHMLGNKYPVVQVYIQHVSTGKEQNIGLQADEWLVDTDSGVQYNPIDSNTGTIRIFDTILGEKADDAGELDYLSIVGNTAYRIKVVASAGGGSGSGGQVEVINKKWSGQYDAVKMGGEPIQYGTSHTVEFDAPSTSLSSINSIRYDISVMAHKHVRGGPISTQGWYRFKGTVPAVGGHVGNHDYEVPYVDTKSPGTNNSSHGNHGSGAVNNYNPYTGETTTGLWYWESTSSVGHDLVNGTIPVPEFPFETSISLDPDSYALGHYPSRPALADFTLTVNANGSVTILLDQSGSGYDGQTAAVHGSIIYGF